MPDDGDVTGLIGEEGGGAATTAEAVTVGVRGEAVAPRIDPEDIAGNIGIVHGAVAVAGGVGRDIDVEGAGARLCCDEEVIPVD